MIVVKFMCFWVCEIFEIGLGESLEDVGVWGGGVCVGVGGFVCRCRVFFGKLCVCVCGYFFFVWRGGNFVFV